MPTFPKTEKLCSQRLIDQLRADGQHFVQFPLRVQYLIVENPPSTINYQLSTAPQVLIWAPKRLFKRANKRNLLRRRMREAYRLHKQPLEYFCKAEHKAILISLFYCANEELDFHRIEKATTKAIQRIITKSNPL